LCCAPPNFKVVVERSVAGPRAKGEKKKAINIKIEGGEQVDDNREPPYPLSVTDESETTNRSTTFPLSW